MRLTGSSNIFLNALTLNVFDKRGEKKFGDGETEAAKRLRLRNFQERTLHKFFGNENFVSEPKRAHSFPPENVFFSVSGKVRSRNFVSVADFAESVSVHGNRTILEIIFREARAERARKKNFISRLTKNIS